MTEPTKLDARMRATLRAIDRREREAGRVGPLGVLGLVQRSGGYPIDVRVRGPLSDFVDLRLVHDSAPAAVRRLRRLVRRRPGPRQNAGEITILKLGGTDLRHREVFGVVLVSTLRRLADLGLIWLTRDPNTGRGLEHGPITMISSARRPWIIPRYYDEAAQP
jgi:hypothetical protein